MVMAEGRTSRRIEQAAEGDEWRSGRGSYLVASAYRIYNSR